MTTLIDNPAATFLATPTANNTVHVVGQCGRLRFTSAAAPIGIGSLDDELMYSVYASRDNADNADDSTGSGSGGSAGDRNSNADRIYLVISSGEIFRSAERDGRLHFEPHNVISENIRKICTGAGFVAIVTESNKLLTTFRERVSARSSATDDGGGVGEKLSGRTLRLRSPRELRKFQRLEVVDAVCGSRHILVHGVHAAVQRRAAELLSSSSLDDDAGNGELQSTTAAEAQLNDLNRARDADGTKAGGDGGGDTLIQTLRRCLTMKDSRNILASRIPVFDSRRLSEETAPEAMRAEAMIAMEKSSSLSEFETLELAEEREDSREQSAEIAVVASTADSDRNERTLEDCNNNNNRSSGNSAAKPTASSGRHSAEENASDEADDEHQREVALQNEMLGLAREEVADVDDREDRGGSAAQPSLSGASSGQSNEIVFIDNGVTVEPAASGSPSTTTMVVDEAADEAVDDVVLDDEEQQKTTTAAAHETTDTMELTLLGEKLTGIDGPANGLVDVLNVQEGSL